MNFKEFKTKLINKYVACSTYVLAKATIPFTFFMRHLLKIQGIDPDKAYPGQKFAKMLLNVFDTKHENSYDEEFVYKAPDRPQFYYGSKTPTIIPELSFNVVESSEKNIGEVSSKENSSLSHKKKTIKPVKKAVKSPSRKIKK